MRVYRDHGHQRLAASSVVTVGNFDGMHLGHQALIRHCQAKLATGEQMAVVTFEPRPVRLLRPGQLQPRLVGVRQKLDLLRAAGVDLTWMMRFNRRLASLPARDFAQMLSLGLNARHVVVGQDFRFGRDREGDFARLAALGDKLGFTAEAFPPVTFDGQRVSSTMVRRALERRELAMAAALLGRPYSMAGRVIRGRQLGRELGFPTANLRLPGRRSPLDGVFAVRARVDGSDWLDGVASLGCRPVVGGGEPLLEVHLFDYSGELYGRRMEVRFVAWIREERDFSGLEGLVTQMTEDAARARQLLAAARQD